jgi:endonuclease/exonuclease/phosphatase family metal-dependent hydrolase
MRIATFNLENLDLRAGETVLFDRRAAVLRRLLDRMAADIVCLQEVNAQRAHHHDLRQLAALERLLAGGRYARYDRAQTFRPGTSGFMDVHNLVILSRFPILESRQIHHDLLAPWVWSPPASGASTLNPVEITWDRPALYMRVDPDSRAPLHILNLHLRASRAAPLDARPDPARRRTTLTWAEGFFLAAQKQIGQALEVRLLVEQIFDTDPSANVLVCGDMNAGEHEMPIRLLCAAGDDTGLADPGRCLVPLEDRLPPSSRYSVRHAGRPVMLDHLIASQTMARRCIGIEIFNEELADEVLVTEDFPGSLHAPLVAEFSD